MGNLKELKKRIAGVKSTQKVTKAMRMVAASKLRRAKEMQEAAKPYSDKMLALIKHVYSTIEDQSEVPILLSGNLEKNIFLLVVITSDRGLCGSFNASIIKRALSKADEIMKAGKEVRFFCVGKKAADVFNFLHKDKVLDCVPAKMGKHVNFIQVKNLFEHLIQLFYQGQFDSCEIVYGKFISALTQEASTREFIPVDASSVDQEFKDLNIHFYEYEPDKAEILKNLIEKNLAVQLYYCFLENAASEHAARMTAMENATKNAGDMIDNLTLVYNRTRQAAVTSELIEIISGAEAI
jgi:F-type H+-transporting ATPase subunit gamma